MYSVYLLIPMPETAENATYALLVYANVRFFVLALNFDFLCAWYLALLACLWFDLTLLQLEGF